VVGSQVHPLDQRRLILGFSTKSWREDLSFCPRVSGPPIRLKKIITWFFNQVLEERVGFNPRVLKKGSWFLSSGLEYTLRIKESHYLVFQPSLEERVLVFILGSRIQPSDIEDDWFLSLGPPFGSTKVNTCFFNKVFKRGFRFWSLSFGSTLWIVEGYYLFSPWVLGPPFGSNYLTFQPSLEERISIFILGSRIQPLDIEDDWLGSNFHPRVSSGTGCGIPKIS
jgi:hypothetical protein